jgi:hypothetical protein
VQIVERSETIIERMILILFVLVIDDEVVSGISIPISLH